MRFPQELPLGGVRVIVNEHCVVDGTPYQVQETRTWRERLFSRPWRPLQRAKTVTVVPKVPAAYMTPMGLLAHPAIVKQLQEQFGTDRAARMTREDLTNIVRRSS